MIGCGSYVERAFNKNTEEFSKVNRNVLFNILNKNSESEIGLKYGFNDIKSIEDFKAALPLSEYSYYDKYIARMANGEKNILITEDVEYFGHTSGTTGKQKLIPVTKSSRIKCSKYMALLNTRFAYNNFKSNWNYGRGLMIADVVQTSYTPGGIPICSATSGGMNGIKKIIPYLYTSPYEVMTVKDKESSLYLHLLFALREKNLLYISGVFISNVLDLLRILEEKHEMLIKDIRMGRINKKISIDEKTKTKLLSYLTPKASRADELEEAFKCGTKGICKKIWPSLTYIASVTGANFSIYDEIVNYYTDSLPICSSAYGATEGMIGINPYSSKIRYIVIPDTVFYEFIPIDKSFDNNPTTFLTNELKIGETYEIVITTFAGLYRYRLGDVVKVVGFYNSSPEIQFLYRKNQVLNMVSEKTTEEHLTTSIQNTMSKLGLSLIDYTTSADNSITPGRYKIYLEIKCGVPCEVIQTIERILDKELRKSNLAYDRFRSKRSLFSPKVIILNEGTFKEIKEYLLSKGVSKNQIKIPRVITTNKNILKVINKNNLY